MVTTTAEEALAIPLGQSTEAEVRIGFGGGELRVRQAPAGMLVTGTFEGGVIQSSRVPGSVELAPRTPALPLATLRPLHWDVALTAEVPLTLRLDTGANRSTVDLTGLHLRRLEIHTGASETSVRLPSTGQTSVDVECGFASVSLEVPAGVAARIRGVMALGATTVDERRFPRTAGGWASPNFEAATDCVDIAVRGGFGSVRVA